MHATIKFSGKITCDQNFASVKFKSDILNIRPISQCLIDRNRPGRRSPDHRVRALQFRSQRAFINLERHINLRRDDILIFHLGLGQRGLLDRRPHHRLGAAIELAGFGEFQQFGDNRRFGVIVHRQIGLVPLAHHAEPLEFLALDVDPFARIVPAFGAKFARRNLVLVQLFLAILFLDLPLDRQAVAIPAGHIRRILAEQALRADDQILQRLVETVPDMDIAIGIRRAVVKNEFLATGAGFAQLFIETNLLPALQYRRFLVRKASLHREIGFRQENRVFIICFGIGHDRGD